MLCPSQCMLGITVMAHAEQTGKCPTPDIAFRQERARVATKSLIIPND